MLFSVLAPRGFTRSSGRSLFSAVTYGIGQYFFTFALLYWALVAGMTSVLFAPVPLSTVFIASAAGYERLSARTIVGAVVAISSLAIIFGDQHRRRAARARRRGPALGAHRHSDERGREVVPAYAPRRDERDRRRRRCTASLHDAARRRRALGAAGLAPSWLALGYLVLSTSVSLVVLTSFVLRWTTTAAANGAVFGLTVTVALLAIFAGEVFGPGFFLGALIVGIGVYIGALTRTARLAPMPAVTAAG